MLRKDGKYVIYMVQCRSISIGAKWHFLNFDSIEKGLSQETIFSEPWRSFTACGECWQRTGEFGCFDIKVAKLFLKQLEKLSYDYKFRLVRITINQHTDILQKWRGNIMKKVEAYQTSDGEKFLKEPEAQKHEDWLRCKAKTKEIEDYLFKLLGIEYVEHLENDEDADGQEEQLANMLKDQGISSLWDDAVELEVIMELIIDVATILDGALLKTAQYAKKITRNKQI